MYIIIYIYIYIYNPIIEHILVGKTTSPRVASRPRFRTEVGKHMKAMMGALQAARCFAAKCER